MEPEEGTKLSDDVVMFMTKRSQTSSPRYITSLKTYADIRRKRRRAAAARRNTESDRKGSPNRKNDDPKDKHADKIEQQGRDDDRTSKKRVTGRSGQRSRSVSWSQATPSDACCGQRRKRRRRPKRRKRSCRRRRSCRRKRRRRRSCSRRRRRRSCRRRRQRRRRRRC